MHEITVSMFACLSPGTVVLAAGRAQFELGDFDLRKHFIRFRMQALFAFVRLQGGESELSLQSGFDRERPLGIVAKRPLFGQGKLFAIPFCCLIGACRLANVVMGVDDRQINIFCAEDLCPGEAPVCGVCGEFSIFRFEAENPENADSCFVFLFK